MFESIRKHAVKVIVAAFAIGNASGCATAPYLPGSQSAAAVKEVCLTERTAEESALCLIGTYNAAVDALADERAAGTLDPQVVAVLDRTINAVSPRLAASQELWGKVAFYREEVEELKPLAEACVKAFSDPDKIASCMASVGYAAATGQLSEVARAAKEDFATVKPLILEVIYAKEAL
jgi:hypothetical protein